MSTDRRPGKIVALLAIAGHLVFIIKPVGDIPLTLAAYVALAASAGISIVRMGLWLSRGIMLATLSVLAAGLMGVVIGLANGNPGVSQSAVVFIAIPAVWVAFAAAWRRETIQAILNCVPLASLVVGLLGIAYWLDASGRASLPWATWLDLGQGLGSEDFGPGLRFYPISSLPFLIPFLFNCLVEPRIVTSRASRALIAPALLLTVILLLVSGRRALFPAIVAGLLLAFVFIFGPPLLSTARRRFLRWGSLLIVVGLGLASSVGFSISTMVESLLRELGSSDDVRTRSGVDLIAAWGKSPWFGEGWGHLVDGPPRSIESPWKFELQYHLILSSIGIIGASVFCIALVALFAVAYRSVRRGVDDNVHLIAIASGAFSIVVANASNPYLQAPGHAWMLFLLVVAVNDAIRRRRRVPLDLKLALL